MGKGSSTTTQNTSTAPDSNAYQAYLALLNRSSGVASTPYQGFGGEETAPVNAQQTAGIGNINSVAGPNSQFVQQIAGSSQPLTADQIQKYQNPYTNDVVDATMADFDTLNKRANSTTLGNAASVGALGGDRSSVAQALTQEGQTRAEAPVIAGLRSSGYQQGVQTAEQQQQTGIQGGTAAQNAALTGAGAQVGAGTLEQQTQQAQDTQARQDYYQQQGYPFQVAQWLASIDTGVGSQMGGTGTGVTQGPQPNPWAQAAGLGIAGASLFAKRGGRITAGFGEGGGVGDDYNTSLSPEDEHAFQTWKSQNAPNDSGADYDLRGAYRANMQRDPDSGHMGDRFKKPNHPTFSDQSQYATGDQRDRAGNWVGPEGPDQEFVPPANKRWGGRIAGFAGGGAPAEPYGGQFQSWVPTGQIHGGAGAPHVSAPSLQKPQGGLTSDQMKGVGVLGKDVSNYFDNFADPGSASNPLPGLTAEDYGSWRGGRISGFADGGAPWGGNESWIPTGNITAGKGAPQVSAPSLPSAQNNNLSSSQMKGLGVIGKGISNNVFDNFADPGSASSPLAGLSAEDYGSWRGGRVKRYAGGGFADGGDPAFDDRFGDAFPNRTTAGIGASVPAFSDRFGDAPVELPQEAHGRNFLKNYFSTGPTSDSAAALDKGFQQPDEAEVIPMPRSRPPNADKPIPENTGEIETADAGVGAINRAAHVPAGGVGASEDVSAYTQPDHGLGAPRATSATPEAAPEEGGLLSKLGIHVTPEMRQGLLQAGLSMMATTRGGPGSFLGAAGESGMAGVGAYNKSMEATQAAADKAHKQAIEDEKLKMEQETHQQTMGASPLIRGPNGQMIMNPAWQSMEKWKAEALAKDNWAPLPGDGIHPDRMYNKVSGDVKDIPQQADVTSAGTGAGSSGQFDYRTNAPTLNKGDTPPEPAVISGHSPDLLKRDAELYLSNGQLPKASVSARSDVGRAQMLYQRAVQNYGVALAASRGLNMAQMADIQRFGTNAAKFPLSRQGDQTVAIGTAIRHIGALEEYAKAWDAAKGNVNAPILRQAAAKFAQWLGKEEPTNLQQAARIAGPEIIKAIGVAGAGTGGERYAQEEGFQPGASTAQILGSANVARTFLAGQLPAKESQARNVGFPHDRFMDMVGPTEYDYLSAINHGKTPESGAAAAVPTAHPANAVGTKTDVNGGKWYVDKDGKAISKAP